MKKLFLAVTFTATLVSLAAAQQVPDPRVADLVQAGKIRAGMHSIMYTKDSRTGEQKACVYRKLDSAIAVMKAAQDRLRGDSAAALHRPMNRGVLLQRSMCPRFIIIGGVCAEDAAQMRFTEHDHMVEAFSSDRADKSLNVSVLPG